jgi:hypothetical protein
MCDKSDVYLPQPQNKIVAYFILFYFCFCFLIDFSNRVFLAFRNKGSSKTRYFPPQNNPSGLINKKRGFSPLRFFFPPSVVLLDFYHRVFGRFVTKGVQKRDKKSRGRCSAAAKTKLTYSRLFLLFKTGP